MISLFQKKEENEYVCFDKLNALVIDDISAMRQAVRSQLYTIGLKNVNVSSNADDAIEQLKKHSFDLVLCDYNLNRSSNGQHFLEHLRQTELLPPTSIFIMLTAEAEYDFVANAVEFLPDDYILKPCSESKLKRRIERLVDKRKFLLPILSALSEKNYDVALEQGKKLMRESVEEKKQIEVLKRIADIQLYLGKPDLALETYLLAAQMRQDVTWIEMGQAKSYFALGKYDVATESATKVIERNPYYVAAYELLSKIAFRAGQEEVAYDWMKKASDILPSAVRFREVSESAFLIGKIEEAEVSAKAALRLSQGSIVEKPDDFLSLAQIQVDKGDPIAAKETLEKNARKHGDLGVFGASKCAILAQAYMATGEHDKAHKLVERSSNLLTNRPDSYAMSLLGKAAIKTGNTILAMKVLTQSIQHSGEHEQRIAGHIKKTMNETGHADKIEDVIDGGRKRILMLVEECTKLMRTAHFAEANQKITEALEINAENYESLLTAAQLHLLWLKRDGIQPDVIERAKHYLSVLDKLLPNNEKVIGFYRFFNEIAK